MVGEPWNWPDVIKAAMADTLAAVRVAESGVFASTSVPWTRVLGNQYLLLRWLAEQTQKAE